LPSRVSQVSQDLLACRDPQDLPDLSDYLDSTELQVNLDQRDLPEKLVFLANKDHRDRQEDTVWMACQVRRARPETVWRPACSATQAQEVSSLKRQLHFRGHLAPLDLLVNLETRAI
jgi:hypothetical protein